jgi:hypothetical protein
MVLPFSTLLFGHTLAAACLIGGFLMAATWRQSNRPRGAGYFTCIGLLLGFAVLTEYTSILGAVPVLLYVFASRVVRPRRPLSGASAVALLTGFAVPLAVYAAYSIACFGSPLSIGYTYEADEAFRATHAVGVVGVSRPRLDVLYYLTFHPIRGIFLQSPILVASVAALYGMAKQREWRLEAAVVGVTVAAFFLMNAGFGWWWAGWTFGPRLLIPMLWFLSLPLVFVSRRVATLLSILILVSTIQMLIPAAGNPLVSDAAAFNINRFGIQWMTGPSPIYDQCLPLLQRGEYTDNLAQRFGLQGGASLLPLVAAWMAVIVIARRSAPTSRPPSFPRSGCRS